MSEPIKKSPAAEREEKILSFWTENQIFEKTLAKLAPRGEFVFFEGPPTANGKPGIHHLEARAFKDAIPRYKTMQGFHVRRKGGWDTHGLPVELQVEKQLGLKSKKEIETYGIAAFNQKCKESVWQYVDDWERFTHRIGYWVDLKNPYVTYETNYIESLWAIMKKVNDDGLLYKDYKVVPWCPRCGTGLSSHELAQGYETVKDLSVTVKFELVDELGTFVLAWTTTPWTLPGNVGLAVGEKIDYVKVKIGDAFLILAKERAEVVLKDQVYEIVSEMKGKELVGKSYKPLYPFLKDNVSGAEKEKLGNAFKIYPASFVTTTDGTGIVHTAVMYGQDDFELGTQVGLPKYHLVSEDGTFKPEVGFLGGKFVKDENVAIDIIKDLAARTLLFKKEKYEHTYPHCWRCKTPLIYFARDSWYIRMSSLRAQLQKENESINWEPAHIKEGRFGEWLKEVKDWAISRERYWGTPLPVWKCDKCTEKKVIGSVAELEATQKPRNQFIVMRHGEAEINVKEIVCSTVEGCGGLTEKGKKQAQISGENLKKEGVDVIIASPLARTLQTAEEVARIIGMDTNRIIHDDRLHEINFGIYNNRPVEEYRKSFDREGHHFTAAPEGGESQADVVRRVAGFIKEVNEKYEGKKILLITHDSPAWLLTAAAKGLDHKATLAIRQGKNFFFENAQYGPVTYSPLPRNEKNEIDLHRPFIDSVTFACSCGGTMSRVKEVMDVWFDSGAMPFAQDHYPFENKEYLDGPGYPADFISEAIDQTRGWFYTLHAVGALLGKGKAYKNVICLGHVLDSQGKKMSKSLGNIVEPWEQIEKYGVDALRLFMYSVNQPGESKNYDEKTVDEIVKKVFNMISNVFTFYQLYSASVEHVSVDPRKSPHVLDQWVLCMLDELVLKTTQNLDEYRLLEPARDIRDFIAELSQWYIRRSRDRFKGEDMADRAFALATTRHVLATLSKLLAPLAPFFAEFVYQELKKETGGKTALESVHLESWPISQALSESSRALLADMSATRKLVTFGLEARAKAKINVRQPLAKLSVKALPGKNSAGEKAFVELVMDEVNVKEVVEEMVPADVEVILDTVLTPALKEEGCLREVLRAIQDLRKQSGLNPSDLAELVVDTDEAGKQFFQRYQTEISKVTNLKNVSWGIVQQGTHLEFEALKFGLKLSI